MAARTLLIIGWAVALGVLGLAATGIWLGFFYRPSAALAWDDIDVLQRQIERAIRVRQTHRQLSLAVPVLIAIWLILVVADRLQKRVLLLAGSLGATLVAAISGLVTPWRYGQLTVFTTGWATAHLLAGLVVAVLVGFALLSNRRASPRIPGEAEQPEPASPRA